MEPISNCSFTMDHFHAFIPSMTREKRSLTLHGHRTSVALEPEFWSVIDQAAEAGHLSLAGLLTQIDDERVMSGHHHGLASYLRIWALKKVQNTTTP